VADRAERILKDPQIAALADKRARELVLALTLATAQFGLHFEQTYQVIFPSQIHTMRPATMDPFRWLACELSTIRPCHH
jgi:hypothetical protein